MNRVAREDLLDWVTYDEQRDVIRGAVLAIKAPRRIIVGDEFTLLFENRDTIRYQIQEMMRAERLVRDADIRHELTTYNELLGDAGELGCTLMVGIDDEAERADKLTRWITLPHHVWARMPDGSMVRPRFDPRQVGDERLSSVQYLKFAFGDEPPVALGIDLPDHPVQTTLDEAQRSALADDLAASRG